MPKLAKASDGKLEGLTFPGLAASCPGSGICPVKSGLDPQDGEIMKKIKKAAALLLVVSLVAMSGMMAFADVEDSVPAFADSGIAAGTELDGSGDGAGDTSDAPDTTGTGTAEPQSSPDDADGSGDSGDLTAPTTGAETGTPGDTGTPDDPDTPVDNSVCRIGDTAYDTLDEAITAAADGDTITLLKDAAAAKTFYKSLTFTGGHTVYMDAYGWRYAGDLVFDGANLEINSDSDSPKADNGEAGRWFTMVLNGSITAKNDANITFNFDSASGTNCAIYTGGGVRINVENNSAFRIFGTNTKGVTGQGIQLDSTANTGIYVTGNSEFLIDGTNRGYVNSPAIYVEDSTFTVQNCTSNGSNGGKFTAVNSEINFLKNSGHGLSATTLDISRDSEVTCNGNAYYGVTVSTSITMDGTSELTSNENGWGFTGGALRLASKATTGFFASNAKVELKDNHRNALENYGTCEFEADVELKITGNEEPINGAGVYNAGTLSLPENAEITCNKATANGGGVYNSGVVEIPASVQLYNNHADTAGDDIYNTGTITFGKVGNDWKLDGAPDCVDAIDGWYDDAAGARWSAHAKPLHVVEFCDFNADGMATIAAKTDTDEEPAEPVALKAAHGLIPVDPDDPDLPIWATSKSKTATNLDSNFLSRVTLSLPSAQETLSTDVVFVLDKSTSAAVEQQILDMLDTLKQEAKSKDAKVKVGVVIFNKVANEVCELTDLATGYDKIEAAIKQEISSGTNLHAGLLAGKAMLDEDTETAANRKYLITVSDGITYIFDEQPTAVAWTFNADGLKNWSGPDNWNSKYGTNDAPSEGWDAWLKTIGEQIQADAGQYNYPYGGTVTTATPADEADSHANSIDTALYNSYQVYQSAKAAGYHCYATTSTSSGTSYLWGPSFMAYLAGGQTVDFSAVQNEILYLLDAGSKVTDKIGKTDEYDFDMVNLEDMILKVGDAEYKAQPTEDENVFTFGDAENGVFPYVVTYHPEDDGNDNEYFDWEINVPVSNFAPVQLTYTVKLMNPKTEAGTYGEYDFDGSQNKAGLYTNNQAILYPVDSNGDAGIPELFKKPTVSYTVKSKTPVLPSDDPQPLPPDDPLVEPDDPALPLPPDDPLEEPDDPQQLPPDEHLADTPDMDDPDQPKTGDEAPLMGLTAALLVSAGALGAICIRRRKTDK